MKFVCYQVARLCIKIQTFSELVGVDYIQLVQYQLHAMFHQKALIYFGEVKSPLDLFCLDKSGRMSISKLKTDDFLRRRWLILRAAIHPISLRRLIFPAGLCFKALRWVFMRSLGLLPIFPSLSLSSCPLSFSMADLWPT